MATTSAVSNDIIVDFSEIYNLSQDTAKYCLEKYSEIIAKAISGDEDQVKECIEQMKALDNKEAFALFQVIDHSLLGLPDNVQVDHTGLILQADYGWDAECGFPAMMTKNRGRVSKRVSKVNRDLYYNIDEAYFGANYLGFVRHINPTLYTFTKYYQHLTSNIDGEDDTLQEAVSELKPMFARLNLTVYQVSHWLHSITVDHIIQTVEAVGMGVADELSGDYINLNSILIAEVAKNN